MVTVAPVESPHHEAGCGDELSAVPARRAGNPRDGCCWRSSAVVAGNPRDTAVRWTDYSTRAARVAPWPHPLTNGRGFGQPPGAPPSRGSPRELVRSEYHKWSSRLVRESEDPCLRRLDSNERAGRTVPTGLCVRRCHDRTSRSVVDCRSEPRPGHGIDGARRDLGGTRLLRSSSDPSIPMVGLCRLPWLAGSRPRATSVQPCRRRREPLRECERRSHRSWCADDFGPHASVPFGVEVVRRPGGLGWPAYSGLTDRGQGATLIARAVGKRR
jgi:hypothetical protein